MATLGVVSVARASIAANRLRDSARNNARDSVRGAADAHKWHSSFQTLSTDLWPGTPLIGKSPAHLMLFTVYLATMSWYTVTAFHNYFTREPTEEFSLIPMSSVPVQSINISVECCECTPYQPSVRCSAPSPLCSLCCILQSRS